MTAKKFGLQLIIVFAPLFLIMYSVGTVQSLEKRDFLGVWGKNRSNCIAAFQRTEGGWFAIYETGFTRGFGSSCEEVQYWFHQDTLRMSGSCYTLEGGGRFFAEAAEFKISVDGTMVHEEKRYLRCSDNFFGQGPSYSCSARLNITEAAICADPDLSEADLTMSLLYRLLFDDAGPSLKRELRRTQRNWVRKRNRCGADKQCIDNIYTRRVFELPLIK